LLAFETIYKSFFSLGLAGSDLEPTKASFTSLLTSLNVNTAQVINYVAALKAYLAVVVANPTQAQKDTMNSKLNLFDTAEVAFIESFQGLNGISLNPGFFLDSRNNDLNLKRTQSSATKTALRLSPETTFGVFTDPTTATNFAAYIVEAIKVSDRIKSGV
jgi:hypothetical protein